MSECRTAAVEFEKTDLRERKNRAGQATQADLQECAPTSLLDDVEQDAFLPG